MTMGLILLAIMAIALFFETGRRSFTSLGVPSWSAFIAIALFAIGIIIPNIYIGEMFVMNIGGFIIPMLVMFALLAVLVIRGGVLRGIASMLSVVALSTVLLLIMPAYTVGFEILTVFVIGLASGAVAYMVSRSPSASLFGVVGGISVGNVVASLINYFSGVTTTIVFGQSVVYNAIFVAIIFAFCLAEIAFMANKMMNEESRHGRRSSNFEAGRDRDFNDEDDYDLFR